ncbi:aldehyde dehydrogenase family protein [Rhodococcus sp. 27YEA15]|uniref:aldehyde dehydrogenase family protein n=1 Tax=Rhodococcus sp. 27YEA15 TaxID=3156259 RepID=UPI003C7BF048
MRIYLSGTWVDCEREAITVFNPATEQPIGAVPECTKDDVDQAVRAARSAFPAWSSTTRGERREFLQRILDGLERRQDDIAATIVADVGTPIRIASRIQATLPLTDIRTYVDLLGEDEGEERIANSLIVREPVGVVAAITPWNYPLHQIAAKLAPALAAGCTVILKPSEVAPMVADLLFEVLDEVGLPPGVVNLIHGRGPTVGEALVGHPDVDLVSFTGSVGAGGHVASVAAAQIKRMTLELGGKSANVVLPDADLTTAVKVGVSNAFLNGGQTCTAWTRLLVPARRHEEALEIAGAAAVKFTPGDPMDPSTKLGPLVSADQRRRVLDYMRRGVLDGARLVVGGVSAGTGMDRGYYVPATVFGNVDPASAIAQDEIFGPVLSVIPYRDEAEALEIANNSPYGLHGAVWSGDQGRALAFARQIRSGQIDVNGAAHNPLAPFGGFKKSGLGRELGRSGLDEFLETKSIQL